MSKKNIDTTYNKEDLAPDKKNLTWGKVKIMNIMVIDHVFSDQLT